MVLYPIESSWLINAGRFSPPVELTIWYNAELPRRKQRGIKSGVFSHAPQAAGN